MVNQRAAFLLFIGMHRHSGFFVQQKNAVVLINNGKLRLQVGEGLCGRLFSEKFFGQKNLQDISLFQHFVGFCPLAVSLDFFLSDPLVHQGGGQISVCLQQKPVQAHSGIVFLNPNLNHDGRFLPLPCFLLLSPRILLSSLLHRFLWHPFLLRPLQSVLPVQRLLQGA